MNTLASQFHHVSTKTTNILEKALCGIGPTRDELLHLIRLSPYSYEVSVLRATADHISKKRFGNKALLLAQTGIESFPCSADCAFCNFAKSNFDQANWKISDELLSSINGTLRNAGGVYAHFLLFMHNFNFEFLLKTVEKTRAQLGDGIDIVLNCGDIDYAQAQEMKAAGVNGSYHAVRLGEGRDTALRPQERIKTIQALKKANLDWYSCCEPIGPEHGDEEIIDQILLGNTYECFQNAVMRRINLDNSPLVTRGQIDLLRSAHIVAIVTLAMIENKALSCLAIHEPDILGLSSGANCIYAEFSANPRDNNIDTSEGRGASIEDCKNMFKDLAFSGLRTPKNAQDIPFKKLIPLTPTTMRPMAS